MSNAWLKTIVVDNMYLQYEVKKNEMPVMPQSKKSKMYFKIMNKKSKFVTSLGSISTVVGVLDNLLNKELRGNTKKAGHA